jgi:ABC-2 type transport system permease protein
MNGARRWLRGYSAMLRFDLAGLRATAALFVLAQVLTGVGTALLYGFYLPEVSPEVALYLTTGAPAMALVPLGFVVVSGRAAERRLSGTADFVRSLPVPRSAAAASEFTLVSVLAVVGVSTTLLLTAWRYGVDLRVSPLIVPAVLLAALMSVSVGYGLGYALDPRVSGLVSNIVVFFALLFAPISFPREQFPEWLARVNDVLPLAHMATVIRDALSDGLVSGVTTAYVVLAAWTAAGWAVAARVVGRRG